MNRKEVFELIVCPTTRENRRNTEADVIELRDGRLLLAYTDFYQYEWHDMSPARISGKISEDGGRTWAEPFTIQENIGRENVMEADLLRLETGEIAFFFCIKNSETDCHPYIKKSFDEGKTWSEPVPIAKFYPGYFTINNDRAIQLRSGRILLPAAYTPNIWVIRNLRSMCFYSDDNGRTWFKGNEIALPDATVEEPGIVSLKDDRILMWLRTHLGYIYKAYSGDRGITWTESESMGLVSPPSPQSMKRIPKTGNLLLIWNNTPGPRRVPLTAAISRDEGETWENIKNLETDEKQTYAYTSITFIKDEVFFTYYCDHFGGLKLKILPIDWFYEKK